MMPTCKNSVDNVPFLVEVVVVIDASGSMETAVPAPQQAAEKFAREYSSLAKTRFEDGLSTRLRFTSFSRNKTTVFDGNPKDLSEVGILAIIASTKPKDVTRLYSTAVEEANILAGRIRAKYTQYKAGLDDVPIHEFGRGCVFILTTDGDDNASKFHTANDVHLALSTLKNLGVNVLFGGAKINAEMVGKSMGVDDNNCLQIGGDSKHTAEGLHALQVVALRSSSSSSVGPRPTFTKEQRLRSCSRDEIAMLQEVVLQDTLQDTISSTITGPPTLTRPPLLKRSKACRYVS